VSLARHDDALPASSQPSVGCSPRSSASSPPLSSIGAPPRAAFALGLEPVYLFCLFSLYAALRSGSAARLSRYFLEFSAFLAFFSRVDGDRGSSADGGGLDAPSARTV
jgi:hypothetical protein